MEEKPKPGPLLSPELQGTPLMGQMYRVQPTDTLASIAEALRAQGVDLPGVDIVQALVERNRLPTDAGAPSEALLLARGVLFIPRLPTDPPPRR